MSKEARRVRLSAIAPDAAVRHINVDRKNAIIRNAVVMIAGAESAGHKLTADQKTLAAIAEFGNRRQNGVIGRLGHPGISEDGSGRQIMTAKNFRIIEDRLIADLHMLEAARTSPAFGNDAVEWMLNMAEEAPEQFALSVVVKTNNVWALTTGEEVDADQSNERPTKATTQYPIIRPVSLHAVDVVVEGALTRGMFSENEASFYAEHVFDFLDEWRAQFNIPLSDVPRKANQFVQTYLQSRGYSEKGTTMPKKHQFNADGTPEATSPPTDDHEVDTQPLDGTDHATDPLAEAEAEANATAQQLDDTEADAETQEEAPATNAELAALREENAVLLSRVERVERLLALNIKNVARMANDISRIDGEPVAKGKVGIPAAFSTKGGSHTPPASLMGQTPGSVTGVSGQSTVRFEDDPVRATFEAQNARAAAFNNKKP